MLGRQKVFVWGAVLVGLLGACAPTFNWREVRVDGSAASALLPCKPDRARRVVPWPEVGDGAMVELSMLSCDVGELTFAWGALRLPAGVDPAQAMAAWQQASVASLQAPADAVQIWAPTPPRSSRPVQVRGWQATGRRPDGRPVQAQALMLATAAELVQLAVYGPLPADVASTLWEGVRVDPP